MIAQARRGSRPRGRPTVSLDGQRIPLNLKCSCVGCARGGHDPEYLVLQWDRDHQELAPVCPQCITQHRFVYEFDQNDRGHQTLRQLTDFEIIAVYRRRPDEVRELMAA